ncbi:MAG: hypothetical protein LBT19_02085 [Candidatus Nomurabacteria bacterium]|jgi:hypothetical protein|nr:hypothetical protein [Candidatus Nomurabacteria bacterium]
MYSSLGIIKNSRRSGQLVGTHQKLDKAARQLLGKVIPKKTYFPPEADILYFEGSRGPDGIKRKSPGVDEPWHFIDPSKDDGKLIKCIVNHQFNLTQALKRDDAVRAAYEAAWMAHAITDGLTPAHHYPYDKVVGELMSDKDYKKLFGAEIKGIMRGKNLPQAMRNNWLYWGAGGVMTKHIAFEYGIAYTVATLPLKTIIPKLEKADAEDVDLKKEFYKTLEKINSLQMYEDFLQSGWTTQLVIETRQTLVPEIIRIVALAWASAVPKEIDKGKKVGKK